MSHPAAAYKFLDEHRQTVWNAFCLGMATHGWVLECEKGSAVYFEHTETGSIYLPFLEEGHWFSYAIRATYPAFSGFSSAPALPSRLASPGPVLGHSMKVR
jgi:hypothetical protein